MLLEIHKNLGFYTTFSRAGPVFVCLLCFFRKNVQLKEVKYTYIYIHIYISPCFPTTNCQQPKKEKKKKEWLTNTMNCGPKRRKILKMDERIYRTSVGHKNLQKWKAHIWRDCLIWINGIWRNGVGKKYIWQLAWQPLIETAGEKQLNAKSPQQAPSLCKVELWITQLSGKFWNVTLEQKYTPKEMEPLIWLELGLK